MELNWFELESWGSGGCRLTGFRFGSEAAVAARLERREWVREQLRAASSPVACSTHQSSHVGLEGVAEGLLRLRGVAPAPHASVLGLRQPKLLQALLQAAGSICTDKLLSALEEQLENIHQHLQELRRFPGVWNSYSWNPGWSR